MKIALGIFLLLIVTSAPADEPAASATAPVRIEFLRSMTGRPPMKVYRVRITIENERDKPAWFLLPYWADKSMPRDGVFSNRDGVDQPFGANRFQGEGGFAVDVSLIGEKGFHAFLLPAKGSLQLDAYNIEAWKDIDAIEVWQASELLVNDKTPLEKWLPYNTLCDRQVIVPSKVWELEHGGKNLDYDENKLGSRDAYSKERVEHVKAVGIDRWNVKFDRMLYHKEIRLKSEHLKNIEYVMAFDEIERLDRYSVIKIQGKMGSAVGSALTSTHACAEIGKIRGDKYFVILKDWHDAGSNDSFMKVGYTCDEKIDAQSYFGNDIDLKQDLKFFSVEEYERLWQNR